MSGSILSFRGVRPTVGEGAFIAPGATVVGDVVIGRDASVWFGCVIRGDVRHIRIGERTNIQDGSIVHVTEGRFAAIIGADVTIGHGCIIHGCTLEDRSFVGMGAIVLDGAVVQSGAMVAAGALVSPGKTVPTGELWAGNPAKRMRTIGEAERAAFAHTVGHYVALAREYAGS